MIWLMYALWNSISKVPSCISLSGVETTSIDRDRGGQQKIHRYTQQFRMEKGSSIIYYMSKTDKDSFQSIVKETLITTLKYIFPANVSSESGTWQSITQSKNAKRQGCSLIISSYHIQTTVRKSRRSL